MGNAYVGKVKIGKTGAKRWQFNDNRELFLSILPASIVQKQNCMQNVLKNLQLGLSLVFYARNYWNNTGLFERLVHKA